MKDYNPDQVKDIESRVKEFLKRHEANVKELQVDFATAPNFVNAGPNVYAINVRISPIDLKYTDKPSPYAGEDKADDKIIKE